MKKIIALLSVALLSIACLALTACGPKDPGNNPPPAAECKLELEQKRMGAEIYYVVIGIGEETSTDIVIPATYNGNPITAIAENAFFGETLTSVVIGSNVTSIGSGAFGNYSGESLTIPASVVTIDAGAFEGATFSSLVFEKVDNWGYQWGPITPVAIPNLTNPANNAVLFTTNYESGWTNNSGTLPSGYLTLIISQR
jgi:hypothetical protein